MSFGGKITRDGVLYIERHGFLVEQICPYNSANNCSHHCPLFGEPFRDSKFTCINLCGRVLIRFDRFKDERRKPNNRTKEKGT